MNHNWNQTWSGNVSTIYFDLFPNFQNYPREAGGGGYNPEGRRYPSPPLPRSALRSPRSPSNPTLPDHHHHHRYTSSTHPSDESLISPTRTTYPTYVHSDTRARRGSSSATPMNGTTTVDDGSHLPLLSSPQAKHAPIPPPPNSTVDEQVCSTNPQKMKKFSG
jgi:hypothetical protein